MNFWTFMFFMWAFYATVWAHAADNAAHYYHEELERRDAQR